MTLVLNGTTGVSSVDGSASTPAIQGNDSNTGVFFPAADTVAIATGGSERLRADSSGNVGIGTSSPDRRLAVQTPTAGASLGSNAVVFSDFANATMELKQSTTQNQWYSNSAMSFATNGSTRATIDSSGNLLVNTTSQISSGKICLSFNGQTFNGMTMQTTWASTGSNYLAFYNSAGNNTGSVSQNGTTTVAYTTSSDYRLKEDVQPMTGALAKVAALKPVTYKWKVDGTAGQGFIAHELAEVVPDAVVGEKDAVEEDGSIKPQGIDTSFLVATLTAAIQELKAELDTAKARIAALEAA